VGEVRHEEAEKQVLEAGRLILKAKVSLAIPQKASSSFELLNLFPGD